MKYRFRQLEYRIPSAGFPISFEVGIGRDCFVDMAWRRRKWKEAGACAGGKQECAKPEYTKPEYAELDIKELE